MKSTAVVFLASGLPNTRQLIGKFIQLHFPYGQALSREPVNTRTIAKQMIKRLNLAVAWMKGRANICEFIWTRELNFKAINDYLVWLQTKYPRMIVRIDDQPCIMHNVHVSTKHFHPFAIR